MYLNARRFVEGLSQANRRELLRILSKPGVVKSITEYPALNEEEHELMQDGRKIMAIKEYRMRTGCSLATAKEVVEQHYPPVQYVPPMRDGDG